MDRSKALLLYGFEEPKEAMINEASNGSGEARSWVGISF